MLPSFRSARRVPSRFEYNRSKSNLAACHGDLSPCTAVPDYFPQRPLSLWLTARFLGYERAEAVASIASRRSGSLRTRTSQRLPIIQDNGLTGFIHD